ncbi:MAG: VWA domain-containing protein [Actinobacteria bacterium]|nr:VWA domain-containing protein [Actinomycetota bacterium]
MSFDWPWALLALLAIPLVLTIAWWSRRRRRRAAVRVTSVALVRGAVPGRTAWSRRVPAALLVLGLAVLAVGAARPQTKVAVSTNSTTIILALDVSGSMCSTDVTPNRITAAEKAATAFIKAQPHGTRMGLVAFAGIAAEIVPPTTDSSKLLDAMKTLTTSRGTAIGQAILTSIDAIAAIDPTVPPTGAKASATNGSGYAAATIVVLTDGANTQGVSPQTAAQQAADRRIRVYTIGFGTTTPTPMVCNPSQVGGGFGGGGGGGGFGYGGGRDGSVNPLVIDEAALKQVAGTTGGRYYRAVDAGQLDRALKDLPSTITVSHKHVDVAHTFAAIGGTLIAIALALSLWWSRVRRPATSPAPGSG